MDQKPKSMRRFFQFRLSTWLVLVGIAAWGMAKLPHYTNSEVFMAFLEQPVPKGFVGVPVEYNWSYFGLGKYEWFWRVKLSADRLLYPALALAAFCCCKGYWLVRRRRRERIFENNPSCPSLGFEWPRGDT